MEICRADGDTSQKVTSPKHSPEQLPALEKAFPGPECPAPSTNAPPFVNTRCPMFGRCRVVLNSGAQAKPLVRPLVDWVRSAPDPKSNTAGVVSRNTAKARPCP